MGNKALIEKYKPQRAIIAANLMKLRELRGFKRDHVCKMLNFPSSSIQQWETAKHSPKLESLVKLCLFYGVKPSTLLTPFPDTPLISDFDFEPVRDVLEIQRQAKAASRNLSLNLFMVRTANNLLQIEFANKFGFAHEGLISQWENGTHLPTLECMLKFSEFTGLSFDFTSGFERRQKDELILEVIEDVA